MSLLARLVPDGAAGASSVQGDLWEEYLLVRARRGRAPADLWYAFQVAALGLPWALSATHRRVAEWLAGLGLDLRSSLRGLRRQPALVAVAVLSLSLGSGLVTAAVTVVNGAWYAPLPWADAHRMVDVGDTHPAEIPPTVTPGTSLRAFEQLRVGLSPGLFEHLEASTRTWVPLRIGSGAASTVRAARVTEGYPELLEFQPRLGRLLTSTDLEPEADPVAVLSHSVWRTAFGGTPDAVGRTVEIDGVRHTVIGVLRADVRPLDDVELLLPLLPAAPDAAFDRRGVQVLGVLAEGVSVDAAGAAVASLASAMYAEAPGLSPGWSASVTPLRTVLARRGVDPMGALATVLLCVAVLLVAGLNLASLLLARATTRAREFGVRAALGAGSLQVARAGLMDGLVLSGAGGALGLLVVVAARNVAVARFAAELPAWASFPIDVRVLLATLAGAVLTAVLVGLMPVVRAVAAGRQAGLARAAVGQSGGSTTWAQNLLLGAQIVVALVLVSASAGALRTFSDVSDFRRLGYRWQGLTGIVVTPGAGERQLSIAQAAARLHQAAGGHPRVRAHTTSRPLRLIGADRGEEGTTIRVGGSAEKLAGPATPGSSLAVGPGYFDLNEIPILAGRSISGADAAGNPPAAVVSRDAAQAMWPDRAPESVVGETFELERDGSRAAFTVVGIAGPVVLDPTADGEGTVPRIYPSILQTPDALYGEVAAGIQLRASISGIPPTVPEWTDWANRVLPGAGVSRVFVVEEVLRQWVHPILVIGSILGGLAVLVLTLVAIGIYGTVSYRIASVRHEIGVRLALGADARRVVGAVLAPLFRVVVVAMSLGAGLALAAAPVLSAGGIPVGVGDVRPLALSVTLMLAATAGASWGPLRHAVSMDPSWSLREE